MKTETNLNTNLKLKKLLALACISLVTSTAVMAEPPSMDAPSAHCKRHDGIATEGGMRLHGVPPQLRGLQLSDDQQDKVFALTYPEIPKIREQMKQRRQLMQEMRSLANNDKLDESKVKVLADKLALLEKDSLLNRTKIDNKIFTLLTPEQRSQLLKNQQQAMDEPEMMPSGFNTHKTHHEGWIKS